MGLFEEASDCIGLHVGLLCIRCQVGAVRDCNYGIEGNRVGKGKLRVLGAFGDSSKYVGSQNGNGGFGHLFCVQFELGFLFLREQKGSKIDNNLGIKKSSIDGKQYLDYS